MWGNVLGVANAHPTGQVVYASKYSTQPVAPHRATPAVHGPIAGRQTNPLFFQHSPFVFTADPPKNPCIAEQHPLPGPPPQGLMPWPNVVGENKFDSSRSVVPSLMPSEPDGEPLIDGDLDRVLAHAIAKRNIDRLRYALEEACQSGMHGSLVRDARDMLLTLEAEESKEEAGRIVDEAIESDDWWKMQGALQRAAAADLPQIKIDSLNDAMQLHSRRKEAATGLRKAIENGDTEDLRMAIEKALTGHVRQKDVDHAREALRELEFRKAEAQRLEQARTKFEMQLREAAATKSPVTLLAVIQAAENGSNMDARSLPNDVFKKAISAARAEMRTQALHNLRDLHQAGDIEGLNSALKDACEFGVNEAEIENFTKRLKDLRQKNHHRNQLRTAVKAGEKKHLLTVVGEAEAAGLGDDEDFREAKAALEKVKVREKEAEERTRMLKKVADERARAEKQAQEKRDAASQCLQHAFCQDDPDELLSAIGQAIDAGISGVDLAPAEERLRVLRGKAGASAQLVEAMESCDVYKLRAAIACVRGSLVDEKLLLQAKSVLNRLTGQADARRKLSSAISSGHADILARAIEEARARGMPRNEIAEAEAALRSAKHTDVGGELRAAMETEDISLMRIAIGGAVDAGINGQQLEVAWDRIRFLENREWGLRELRNAVASGDSARLQVAISHAEQAKVAPDEVISARKEFDAWVSKRQAQQELQLARASGSAATLHSALRNAKSSGLEGAVIGVAETELRALQRGGAWRPPPPTMSPPPPPPCGDHSSDEDEDFGDEHRLELQRTLTDPKMHLPASRRVSWEIGPESQPPRKLSVDSDLTAPPTDPQLHSFPAPPPSW